ncbi:hypothetical protein [Undibacterium sp.]|uniref:hypothetical protein n=1 Tax=Undibacterium sp. TaxID=1914977 RepID=UPI0025DD213F|nr:hypothetical protein [Undibacterium sp.]
MFLRESYLLYICKVILFGYRFLICEEKQFFNITIERLDKNMIHHNNLRIPNTLLFFIISLAVAGCASSNNQSTKSSDIPTNSTPQTQAVQATKNKEKNQDVPGTRKVMSKDGDFEGEIVGVPKPSSKFSKLIIGMSKRQVEDLIGQPTDFKAYQTGKAWIPFGGIFSKDTYRVETFYKGEGQLVYAKQGTKLFRIIADPTANGYQ